MSKDCYLSFCGTRTAFTETNRSKQLGAVIHLDRMQEALGPHSRAATTMPRVKEAALGREISGQHAGGLGDLSASLRRLCLGSSQHGAEPNECPLILIAGKMSSALFDALEDYLTSYLCVKSAMY